MTNDKTEPKQEKRQKRLTLDLVLKFLYKRGLINQSQYQYIKANSEAQTRQLIKHQENTYSKRVGQPEVLVSPAELIASLNIEKEGVEGKYITEDEITQLIAEELKIPYIKIDPLKLKLDTVTSYIPRPFALRHLIVPLDEKDGVITIAVADPFNLEAANSAAVAKKIKTTVVLSSKGDILKIIREFFGFRASIAAAQREMSPILELGNLEQYVKLRGHSEIEANDQHIINAVDYLLQYAFDQRASDIHVEPKREMSHVRFRIDGVIHYIYSMPKPVHAPVASRIKMLSRMDIAEKRRPQDGRIKTHHKGKELELRVSTLPVAFGEKIVIRIFDPDILMQNLDEIGFYERELQLYNAFINRPNGIILVTGPTGSGKTTTLYSTLKILATPEVNVITIEDPIEMVVEDLNQVGVQSAVGVTFSNILRTILRQDPDIIMVGEIRDKETAENAVQSALTGHLVLSTLHTNDAPSSIIRLLDLGVPAFLISSTLIGIIAQRLMRKICQYCKTEKLLTKEEILYLQLDNTQTYTVSYGEGCNECRGTGYKGRTGIFEVMEITEKVKNLLNEKADLISIQKIAKEDGIVTLRQAAIKKMLDGITTYEEVVAIT